MWLVFYLYWNQSLYLIILRAKPLNTNIQIEQVEEKWKA